MPAVHEPNAKAPPFADAQPVGGEAAKISPRRRLAGRASVPGFVQGVPVQEDQQERWSPARHASVGGSSSSEVLCTGFGEYSIKGH